MIKQLHSALLFVFVLLMSSLQAQEEGVRKEITLFDHETMILNLSIELESNEFIKESVFSYISNTCTHDHSDHSEHSHLFSKSISLIDIISSDEGADFNCSGGFCMDKSHFHKRGLTLKKQLFDYFMKISC